MFLNHHHLQLLLLLLLISMPCIKPIQLPDNPNLMELSYPINENTLHWITARSFQKNSSGGYRNARSRDGSSVRFWYATEDVAYNSHTGTHLDAPCHFARDVWCVHDIPIEHLLDRPVYVLDVRVHVQMNSDYQASVDHFESWFRDCRIKNGSLLFILTKWSAKWPIKDDYFGIRKGDEGRMHFPGISPELADHIVSLGKFVGVGIDGPSIDPGLSPDKYAHRKFAENNIYNIENLPNMAGMQGFGDASATIAPMHVEEASGSPVRVFIRNHAFGTPDNPPYGYISNTSGLRATPAPLLCLLVSLILLLRTSFMLK